MTKEIFEYSVKENLVMGKDLRFHPELSSTEKLFYAEIDAMSQGQPIPLNSKKLKEIFNVSSQTVNNWIRNLASLKLIDIAIECIDKEMIHTIKTNPIA